MLSFLPYGHTVYYGGSNRNAYVDCRLDTKYPLCNMFRLFMCAVCQAEMKPGEGISIHYGSSKPGKLRPWDGPFLCLSCQEKKEAMEGKRPSGGMASLSPSLSLSLSIASNIYSTYTS
jgi:hypothetical protein